MQPETAAGQPAAGACCSAWTFCTSVCLPPAQYSTTFTGLQVVTKGKPKQMPHKLESGVILELGNFCCEYDQEVQLEDFK